MEDTIKPSTYVKSRPVYHQHNKNETCNFFLISYCGKTKSLDTAANWMYWPQAIQVQRSNEMTNGKRQRKCPKCHFVHHKCHTDQDWSPKPSNYSHRYDTTLMGMFPACYLIRPNVWERTHNVTSPTAFCTVFSILIWSDVMNYNIFGSLD